MGVTLGLLGSSLELLGRGPCPPNLRRAHHLAFRSKKRRVRKRVESVQFWLDAKSYLPRKVEYLSKDGSTREVRFHDIQINPDLAAGIFTDPNNDFKTVFALGIDTRR